MLFSYPAVISKTLSFPISVDHCL